MTKLTDLINSYIPIGLVGGVSAQDMRDAILALNDGALTINDTVTGSIASITIVGMYEAVDTDLSDSPVGVSSGSVYILATMTEAQNWTYYLTDNTAALFTGVRLVGNNTINWKASGDGTGGGTGEGNLLSDGTIPMDVGYDPGTEGDAQVIATKAYVDSLGGSIPASYPKGLIGSLNQQNIDAVTQSITVSVAMTGVAGRLYEITGKLHFISNSETNGEVAYSFTTRTATSAIERQDFGSDPIFDMQLASTARAYSYFQKFNKSTAGTVDFNFQLKGTWGTPTDLSVDVYVFDLGEGTVPDATVPDVVPTVLHSFVEDNKRDEIVVETDLKMTSTAFDGITFPGKTIQSIGFDPVNNWFGIVLDSDIEYFDTNDWSYDASVFGSDLRSEGANVELASGSFTVTNNINSPPTVSPVVLPDMLDTDPPIQITQAQLLATALDPEGDPMTAQNASIGVGTGSLVFDNPDWTYTEAGISTIQINYEVTDGDYIVPNTASFDVKGLQPDMVITSATRNTDRRIDVVLDKILVTPSTETAAIPNFALDQGVTIDRVKQNNPGTNVLNVYADQDIPTGVALNLTYTKDGGGENVVATTGEDYPDGAYSVNNP